MLKLEIFVQATGAPLPKQFKPKHLLVFHIQMRHSKTKFGNILVIITARVEKVAIMIGWKQSDTVPCRSCSRIKKIVLVPNLIRRVIKIKTCSIVCTEKMEHKHSINKMRRRYQTTSLTYVRLQARHIVDVIMLIVLHAELGRLLCHIKHDMS